MKPEVCVVVPVLDRVDYLRECLSSVLAQSFGAIEVVVVDDGSSDGSQDVARDFVGSDARVRLVTGPHRGLTRSRQLGAALASDSVTLLAHMDSDDLWLPSALATLRAGMKRSDIGSSGLARLIDEAGLPVPGDRFEEFLREREGVVDGRYVRRRVDEPTVFADQIHLNRLYPAGILLLRLAAYQRSLGHDPRFSMGEDWDMSLRLLRNGPLSFVDDVVLLYRQHTSNMSRDRVGVVECSRRIWSTTYYDKSLTQADRRAVTSGWPLLMRRRSAEKFEVAKNEWRQRRPWPAATLALDAAAQTALRRPLRRWAAPPLTERIVEQYRRADLAACKVEGAS